jgi:hypothetical protein
MVLIAALVASSATIGPARAEAPPDDVAFDCYAPTPRSHAYEIGDYARALRELEPLANDRCPRARRLLAILYARGQGSPKDLVRAYAYLLVAFTEGVTPFGGDGATAPVLGDDPNEFEIVQFGSQLSDAQLRESEKRAAGLISPRSISSTGAIGPTGVADTNKELRPRIEAYRLKGRTAVLGFPRNRSTLAIGMRRAGSDRVLAQAVTDLNSVGIPHELLFIEAKMREIGSGSANGRDEFEREMGLATSKGEHFVWLSPGARVRLVRYGVNPSFASQITPLPDDGGARSLVYWVDSCFINIEAFPDPRPAAGARSGCP